MHACLGRCHAARGGFKGRNRWHFYQPVCQLCTQTVDLFERNRGPDPGERMFALEQALRRGKKGRGRIVTQVRIKLVWMDEILHHPRNNGTPLFVGIYRGIIIPKVS